MSHRDSWRDWVRVHWQLVDIVLVTVLFVLLLFRPGDQPADAATPQWLFTLVPGAVVYTALAFRRRWPVFVLAIVVCAAGFIALSHNRIGPIMAGVMIALWTVATTQNRRTAHLVGGAAAASLTAVVVLTQDDAIAAKLAVFAWTGLAVAAGSALRSHRNYVASIRERAERAEQTREEEANRRVTEERLRIARELHDVIAHHVALVGVQAGVAAHLLDRQPETARDALKQIRTASESALDELRMMVGLLRAGDDPATPTEPAPGLDRLDDLVTSFNEAGLPVRLEINGSPRPLPGAANMTTYRVIQEALTNTRKHTDSAVAEVRIAYAPGKLLVTVEDDGTSNVATVGTGYGIIGMRERAAALGGSLEAGPRGDGGYRVALELPLSAPR